MDGPQPSRVELCLQCGACTGGCPEAGITPFNIRLLVRKTLLGHGYDKALPWYCTSCGHCTLRCPRDVRPAEMIAEARSALVERGRVPMSIQKALENAFVQKNPWGRPRTKRADWAEQSALTIPHVSETASGRLLFTCCIQAYDPRCMVIPVNVATILAAGGLEFGILGAEEACCGNEIRRLGEQGLFEELQEENLRKFRRHGVREIIALSPHCMNTLKREYGETGIPVRHYTEVLADLLEEGALAFKGSFDKRVIYHDPCFLGRQSGIFDAPRGLLRAVDGVELLEFTWSRENSLCCEGGGGRMFYEAEGANGRTAEKRVAEAVKKGAAVLATACPFCVMTLEDPATEKGMPVKELSEILVEVL